MSKTRLFDRNFTLTWLGRAVSQLGDGAGYIGLMWWVTSRSGSAALLALLAVCRTVAAIVFSPIGGAVADRANKRAIIVATDALRGVFYGIMAYMIITDKMTVPLLLGLAVANTLCAQFFDPAIISAVPLIVDKSNLAKANSFMQMSGNIVQIVGYGAGGALISVFGVSGLLVIDSVSYFLSAISEVFIVIPDIRKRAAAETSHFVQELKDGFAYVVSNKVLFEAFKVAAVLNLLMAPIFILLPEYVKTNLNGSPVLFAYLTSAGAAGVLIATLLISMTKFVDRNLWTVIHGITIQSGVLLLFVLTPNEYPIAHVGLFVVFGLLNGIVNIYIQTLIQRITAPEQLGRVAGVLGTMCMRRARVWADGGLASYQISEIS